MNKKKHAEEAKNEIRRERLVSRPVADGQSGRWRTLRATAESQSEQLERSRGMSVETLARSIRTLGATVRSREHSRPRPNCCGPANSRPPYDSVGNQTSLFPAEQLPSFEGSTHGNGCLAPQRHDAQEACGTSQGAGAVLEEVERGESRWKLREGPCGKESGRPRGNGHELSATCP